MCKNNTCFGENGQATYIVNQYFFGIWDGFVVSFAVFKTVIKEFFGLGEGDRATIRASVLK